MVTAVILASIYLGGGAAYLIWATLAVAGGASVTPFIAGAVLVFVSVPVLAAMLWFTLAWIYRSPRPPEMRIGPAAALRLVVDEIRAIARSGPRMAFWWWRMRDPAPAAAAAPVLLLHGVLCNAGVWQRFLARLADRGICPVYALSYGPPWASIDVFADEVAAKVREILAATGARKVTLVGHSMGGLVARAYLRRYGGESVRSMVTIGTPHHGSIHAWLFGGTCLGELRPGSPWLAELNRGASAPASVRSVSLWSWHDSMVAPQVSARLAGALNVEMAGIGHNAMLYDRDVFLRVADELDRAAREANAETRIDAPPTGVAA